MYVPFPTMTTHDRSPNVFISIFTLCPEGILQSSLHEYLSRIDQVRREPIEFTS